MSFNRLPYDNCSYEQVLRETTGPGFYQLTTPPNSCQPCHPKDPRVRLQSGGVSLNKNTHLIDVNSELIGISRNLSSCPKRRYLPDCNSSQHCGAQSSMGVDTSNDTSKVKINYEKEVIPFTDCFLPTEDTRLSNPPCNLRGTGINRWEWLCKNPQAETEVPFDFQISSRILSKINHRPCIPKQDQLAHPDYNDEVVCDNLEPLKNTCAVPTGQLVSMAKFRQY